MGLLTTHVEAEELIPGLIQHIIHPRRVAYQEAGYLRPMFTNWEDSGDGNHPHVVADAPMMIRASDTGIMRWHPTRDTQVWMEIGDPVFRPAGGGPVQTFDFANPTRNGNRIRWSRNAADLIYDHGGHFGKFGLVLKTAARPLNREFAFPLTYQGLVRNGRVLSYQGQDVMHMRPFDAYDLDDPLGTRINVPHEFRNVQGQEFVVLTLPIEIDSFARPVLDPTLVLQPDATDGLDAAMHNIAANNNFGVSTNLYAGKRGDGNRVRSLIQFDLSSIPSSAEIADGTLSLHCHTHIRAKVYRANRVLVSWEEGVNDNATPGGGVDGCTWNNRNHNGSIAWDGAGCDTAGSDYLTRDNAITIDGAAVWYDWDVQTDVAAWVAGSAANYGSRLWCTTDNLSPVNTDYGEFYSSDHGTAATRPVLTVAYTVPAAAPSNLAAVLCP